MKMLVHISLLAWGGGLVATTPAYAYLDPGSGSMLLQLLLGGVAGVAVIMKLYWYRVLTFMGIRKEQQELTADSPPAEAEEQRIEEV